MNEQLQKKVDFAIRLLQGAEKMAEKVGQPVEICYSGGKDSDAILELARMSGIKYRAIYKNTTIDPPGTIAHAKAMGVEVVEPKRNFLNIIAQHGYPSRRNRFCCSYLKEYKILDYAVVGVRRDESKKRADRYQEPEICRVYSKKVKARQYLPLLEWTSQDVADFINERGLKVHTLYYDEQGELHPERRLGCLGCPLAYRRHRIEEFKHYPGFVKLYLRGGAEILGRSSEQQNPRMVLQCLRVVCISTFLRQYARVQEKVRWQYVLPAHRLQEISRRLF